MQKYLWEWSSLLDGKCQGLWWRKGGQVQDVVFTKEVVSGLWACWKGFKSHLVCLCSSGNFRAFFLVCISLCEIATCHCLRNSQNLLAPSSGTDVRKMCKTVKPAPGQGQVRVLRWSISHCSCSFAAVSWLLHRLSFIQDYELEAEKLRSLLDLENGRNSHVNKRARLQSPAAKVKEEVSCEWRLPKALWMQSSVIHMEEEEELVLGQWYQNA